MRPPPSLVAPLSGPPGAERRAARRGSRAPGAARRRRRSPRSRARRPADAAFPGDDGRIAAESAGGWARGAAQRRPAGRAAAPARPARAGARRSRRAASGSPSSAAAGVWAADAGGAHARPVTTGRDPAWSPGGDELVVVGGRRGSRDLYRVRADGSARQRLTFRAGDEGEPAWSALRRDRLRAAPSAGRGGAPRPRPRRAGPCAACRRRAPTTARRRGRPTAAGSPSRAPSPAAARSTSWTRTREPRAPGSTLRPAAPGARGAGAGVPAASPARRSTRARPPGPPAGAGSSSRQARAGAAGSTSSPRTGPEARARSARATRGLRAPDWQPGGLPPVIAAAGDVACDPAAPEFAGRRSTAATRARPPTCC